MTNKDINMAIKMGAKSFVGIKDLSEGRMIDEAQIESLCEFVDLRYDCADFRAIVLIKTLYAYKKYLSDNMKKRIRNTLLNFKYWMDEPGEDSMCYWSENHQLLFHTCEYLAGQLMPEEIFTNNNMSGKEHNAKAEPKILQWLKHKWLYGFIEWHSNTYYEEDIAPLVLLVDYAKNPEIREKAKVILDLLFLDIALYSYEGYFSVSSGRCYEQQKKNCEKQDTLQLYKWAFDDNFHDYDYERISSIVFLTENYEVPKLIKLIAKDKIPGIIKDSMGLSLKEVPTELGMDDMNVSGAYLWQMEAFTNVESINMTMDMFNKYNMGNNVFLKDLKMINYKVLRKLNLLPLLVRILNPSTQGVAIQRSNNYTFKQKYFILSTSMRYHPGEFGDQHHIWHATLPNNINVFTTHPGAPMFDDNARNFSPDYWVGNGILPDSVQEKNIHISIYKLNQRKGFLERNRQLFSHAYFPIDKFDEVKLMEKRAFGRINNTYIQLIGSTPLLLANNDELIQKGAFTIWVCELESSESTGSFDNYIKESLNHELNIEGMLCKYKNISLSYKGDYKLDGKIVNTDYKRLESPYGQASRKPSKIVLSHLGNEYTLSFKL